MLRSDLIYRAMRTKLMKLKDTANWLGMNQQTLHRKIGDTTGKHLTLHEAESLMLLLGLPAEVFMNNDHISCAEMEKRVAEEGFTLKWKQEKIRDEAIYDRANQSVASRQSSRSD